ncbi:MAG: terminase large subunit [Anaerolineae bacterium]|nr:terminase large subunit [Anaerolineae bacterium]
MTRPHHPSNAELREEAERQLLLATIRLARAINNKAIQAATLKDRAAALGVTSDRFLKFAAAPDESDDRIQLVFEGEEPTDADHHHAEEAARGPETDLGVKVLACGRRFGKTELGKLLMIERAVRGGQCWWLAPTYGMAGQVWRDLRRTLAPLRPDIDTDDRRMTLPGGGMIAVRSAHTPDRLRGAGLDFAVLDEAAFMPDSVWPEVIRPMLLDRRGGAAFLSTPYGFNGFWGLYQLGLDPSEPEWASFHAPSSANPRLDSTEIEAIRRVTPERVFRAEYLAEFIDDAGVVFREVGRHAAAPLADDGQPREGGRYIAGCDWGRVDDYTAVAVIDADSGRLVALDRFTGVGWAVQRGRVSALCQRWNVSALWAEENAAGSVNIEALQADGLPVRPFVTTSRSKPALIDGLVVALERGELSLLDDPVLLSELSAYRLTRLPGGGYRYSAPPGGHDDTVIAVALAWHGSRQGRVGIGWG